MDLEALGDTGQVSAFTDVLLSPVLLFRTSTSDSQKPPDNTDNIAIRSGQMFNT